MQGVIDRRDIDDGDNGVVVDVFPMSTCVQHGNVDEEEAATLAGLCGGAGMRSGKESVILSFRRCGAVIAASVGFKAEHPGEMVTFVCWLTNVVS